MPDRVGTRWDGGHLEVPVGSAVAVWRLISDKGRERESHGELACLKSMKIPDHLHHHVRYHRFKFTPQSTSPVLHGNIIALHLVCFLPSCGRHAGTIRLSIRIFSGKPARALQLLEQQIVSRDLLCVRPYAAR